MWDRDTTIEQKLLRITQYHVYKTRTTNYTYRSVLIVVWSLSLFYFSLP